MQITVVSVALQGHVLSLAGPAEMKGAILSVLLATGSEAMEAELSASGHTPRRGAFHSQ